MRDRQGESRLCLSPISLPYVSLLSLSPMFLFYLSRLCLSPISFPYLSPLCLSLSLSPMSLPETDRGGTWGRETGEKHGAERQGRNMGQRNRGKTWVERHQRTPYPHSLAPPHNLNLSTTILSQIHFFYKKLNLPQNQIPHRVIGGHGEFDFATNSNAYTAYTTKINSATV